MPTHLCPDIACAASHHSTHSTAVALERLAHPRVIWAQDTQYPGPLPFEYVGRHRRPGTPE